MCLEALKAVFGQILFGHILRERPDPHKAKRALLQVFHLISDEGNLLNLVIREHVGFEVLDQA